jgi:hypothetical protein
MLNSTIRPFTTLLSPLHYNYLILSSLPLLDLTRHNLYYSNSVPVSITVTVTLSASPPTHWETIAASLGTFLNRIACAERSLRIFCKPFLLRLSSRMNFLEIAHFPGPHHTSSVRKYTYTYTAVSHILILIKHTYD